ncbi:peptidylprolyl isomerase [Biformimicrobium ophioploci]|uniref:Peptidyl-prolyl cis-trans isomerase n=1 Tax=Biformimicrobium ophioploci TaxID=3036711 RepID=A0ABQ6LYR8_9GAMM|nr:peptidylprolyl isomerase [Microbulbifer sp. NKW57]GMG87235.1 peptidylprolyl isomerase [Microbulbifer sp. NKW57]
MNRIIGMLTALLLLAPVAFAKPVVKLETTAGNLTIELHEQEAPKTVDQFIKLVEDGFYDGKEFYRLVKDFVAQAGDVDGKSAGTVPLETSPKHRHVKGAVGLARDADPNSGTTEFYICLTAIPRLDGHYAVFGQVIEGMGVLDALNASPVEESYIDYEGKQVAFHKPSPPIRIIAAQVVSR